MSRRTCCWGLSFHLRCIARAKEHPWNSQFDTGFLFRCSTFLTFHIWQEHARINSKKSLTYWTIDREHKFAVAMDVMPVEPRLHFSFWKTMGFYEGVGILKAIKVFNRHMYEVLTEFHKLLY